MSVSSWWDGGKFNSIYVQLIIYSIDNNYHLMPVVISKERVACPVIHAGTYASEVLERLIAQRTRDVTDC